MHTADMTEDTQSTEHEQPGGSATAGDTSLSPRVALFAPGASAEEIASLEQVIGSSWPELRIVTWPDGQAFSTSAVWFRACVLHVKGPSPLEGELAARPQALPLIAVGGHDPGRARPNVWLREVNPKLLGAVLQAFLMEPDGASVVAHRADDDLSVQVVAPPIIA